MSPNSWMKSLCFPSGSPSMVPSIIHLEGFDWTRRMTPWMLLSPAFNCTTPDSNGVSEEKDFNMSCMLNELKGCNSSLLQGCL